MILTECITKHTKDFEQEITELTEETLQLRMYAAAHQCLNSRTTEGLHRTGPLTESLNNEASKDRRAVRQSASYRTNLWVDPFLQKAEQSLPSL